ncbi:MAG: alpha/beta hydrolase [Bdellovibrionia bacterium]
MAKRSTFWRNFSCLSLSTFLALGTSSCSSLFYFPSHTLYYSPKRLGYEAKQVSFHAQDGTTLYAWLFKPPEGSTPPRGTIIQFHGNAENMSSHYLSLAWLVEQGYQLVAFDYRGYGKSEGDPSQKGTYLDALAALDLAWKFHQENHAQHFIVFGQSLGGAIATRALQDFPQKDKVDLLVLDSTFTSYKSVARRKLASFWLTWPISPLGGLLVSDSYNAEDALKDNKSPVLIIHDRSDPVMPFSCGEDSYRLATAKKEFWQLDQGDHIAAFNNPQSPYRKRLVEFLDRL